MPLSLDFPEITDAFRQFLLLPLRPIAHSFERLALWLGKRVRTADLLEAASRDFPVIRFRDDAVMLSLDRVQQGGLASTDPPATFAAHLSRAGQGFVTGIARVKEAAEEDLILPNLFGTFEGAIAAIAASVERFAHPPGEMAQELFGDPRARSAIDLFGEAALAWRSIAGSTYQVKGFAGHVGKAIESLATPGGTAEGSAPPLAEKLDRYARYVLGALLVLPALPAFAVSLWESFSIVLRSRILDAFARIEARVFAVRRKIVDWFYVDLRRLVRTALSTTIAAALVLAANIRFFTRFADQYGALVLRQLTTFFDELRDYFNNIINGINSVLNAINNVLQFNLSSIIAGLVIGALGPTLGGPVAGALPKITVDDLITLGTDLARAEARKDLTAIAEAVNLAAQTLPLPSSVSDRIAAVPTLIWNALRPPRDYPAEAARPTWPPGYGFPNLYETVFAPGLPGLRKAFSDFATTVPQNVGDIAAAGSAALDILGDQFAEEGARAARAGSEERFRRLAEKAGSQARMVFGTDIDALQTHIAEQRPDPVAESFGAWVATGFQVVQEALPAYLREIRAFWREKEARGEELTVRIDMTSPHILARRAKLARVKLKTLAIDASGHRLDGDLAAEVAARFRDAVQQAFAMGTQRLAALAVSEVV